MSRCTPAPTLAASRVLVAGLAVVLVGVLAGCGSGAGDSTGDSTATTGTSSLELSVPAAQTGRCMAPNVDNLQAQDTAFEGVVTAVADGIATLEVTQSFKGKDVETVTVAAPSEDLQDLVLAVNFEQGETYLVSSLDGRVSVCGLSGPTDDLLLGLYQQAYTG